MPSPTLFIDTEINRNMLANDYEKLLYDAVLILKNNAASDATEEGTDE